ncbi:hypothetical protein HMI56_001183 [Coelomomyces lativittatus]|nr:hypothetical protein HMI56_001183 [Coelomomyces lativittatus]
MICAPLFRHTPMETDFLVLRIQSKRRETRWYLREISSIFTVGQIFPALEIAPPTSRIYTEYKRNRIRIAAFRLLKKRQEQAKKGVKFSELQNLFPHYAEVQLKSRLKEFMEGRGLQSGHWRLKGGATVPSEEEIRKMVTPEQVCMYETMCAAYRQLEDLGYTFNDTEASRSPELTLEEELAPWKITKNFAMAVAHKHFLKIEGKGDPTGCGEGFSFLRASNREIFGKWTNTDASRFTSQEQWSLYKSKIKEIWQRQLRSLSNTTSLFEPFECISRHFPSQIAASNGPFLKKTLSQNSNTIASPTSSSSPSHPPLPPSLFHGRVEKHPFSAPPINGKKYLSIKRRMKGSTEWQEEIVTDSRVISAYLKLKQQLANAGEGSAIDKFRRQKLLSESRDARENQIQEVLRNSREVRCRRCGLIGHIKTNREKCPAWKPDDDQDSLKLSIPRMSIRLPFDEDGRDDDEDDEDDDEEEEEEEEENVEEEVDLEEGGQEEVERKKEEEQAREVKAGQLDKFIIKNTVESMEVAQPEKVIKLVMNDKKVEEIKEAKVVRVETSFVEKIDQDTQGPMEVTEVEELKTLDDSNSLILNDFSSKRRKRKNSNSDMCEFFTSILEKVTASPEVQSLFSLDPVLDTPPPTNTTMTSTTLNPLVPIVQSLQQLKQKSESFSYSSIDSFLHDVQSLYSLAIDQHGPDHPLTEATGKVTSMLMLDVQNRLDELKALEPTPGHEPELKRTMLLPILKDTTPHSPSNADLSPDPCLTPVKSPFLTIFIRPPSNIDPHPLSRPLSPPPLPPNFGVKPSLNDEILLASSEDTSTCSTTPIPEKKEENTKEVINESLSFPPPTFTPSLLIDDEVGEEDIDVESI